MNEQIEKLEHGLMICEATGTELVHIEKEDAEKILVLLKEQFVEAFNTIRDAYNTPANREKILQNYVLRNACCCEQKL